MPRQIPITSAEEEAAGRLGRQIRLARLRRNLSQSVMAGRAGVTRKTWIDLEAGRATVSLSVLIKALSVLGYLHRLPSLLESDPMSEGIELDIGRKKAGRRRGANF